MAAKLKKGDRVIVLAGKDKGKSGEIVQVMPAEERAIVRGCQPGQAPSAPVSDPGRRHYYQRSPHPSV